mgnify:CR=1 FL=1
MEMPQEIEVWYVIPAIRRDIATVLKSRGIKQTEVAKIMGITKSAVTQYLNSKRAKDLKFSENVKKEIEHASKRINNPIDTIREIQYVLTIIRKENAICELHKNMDKRLPSNCDVCFNVESNVTIN